MLFASMTTGTSTRHSVTNMCTDSNYSKHKFLLGETGTSNQSINQSINRSLSLR